jgi:hypothetical protein
LEESTEFTCELRNLKERGEDKVEGDATEIAEHIDNYYLIETDVLKTISTDD